MAAPPIFPGMEEALTIATGLLGMFMALPAIAMARARRANLFLGLFLLSLSLLSLSILYVHWPGLWGLFDWPLAGIGLFYYCYVREMTGLGNGRRQAWQFLPLLFLCGAIVWARLSFSPAQIFRWLFSGGATVFHSLLLGFQVLAVAYAIATLYRLGEYRRRLRQAYSSVADRDLNWLMGLSMVLLVLLLVWIPANVLGGPYIWVLVIGRLLAMYFVGWYGLRQPAVFLPLPADAVAEKYARSGMTAASKELIGARLDKRMQDHRDFQEPELSLAELAERIGTSPQLLSQYLNEQCGQSFFDYINALRVAHVQSLLRAPVRESQTLLEVAFAAGFNSKSTFNAAFKKVAGMPPSAWRKVQQCEPTGAHV